MHHRTLLPLLLLCAALRRLRQHALWRGQAEVRRLSQRLLQAPACPDSRSNRVLAAYVDRQIGKKYDIDLSQGVGSAVEKGFSSYSKAYSTWAYAEAAFDYWAGLLRKRLDEAHGR